MKYNSGVIQLWCTYYVVTRFWNEWGVNGYLSTTTDNQSDFISKTLPNGLCKTVDNVQVTAVRGGCLIDARLSGFNPNYVTTLLWSSVNFNREDQTVGIMYNIWGTWK